MRLLLIASFGLVSLVAVAVFFAGGFLGADGINPIGLQILVGTSSREWLEANYFDKKLNSISGITHMVPKSPTSDENIIDGLIIFAPQLFEESCDLLKDAHMYFDKLGKKRIDMSKHEPAFWNDLVIQAKPCCFISNLNLLFPEAASTELFLLYS